MYLHNSMIISKFAELSIKTIQFDIVITIERFFSVHLQTILLACFARKQLIYFLPRQADLPYE